MMDEHAIHGRKPPPFDFKHVRKFAVEHFKKIQHGPSVSSTSSRSPSTADQPLRYPHRPSRQRPDARRHPLELSTMEKNLQNESESLTTSFLEKTPKNKPKIEIKRDVLNQEAVIKQTRYATRDKSIKQGLHRWWDHCSFLSIFKGIFPIFQWLPKYSVQKDLTADIVAGLTVAIMNIPHGMAYGILAGVSPSNGLYTSIFPVLIYLFLGTSKHISIGTFAVISIMTYKVVQTHAPEANEEGYTPIQVVGALAIMTGVVHLIMAIMRLGLLSSLLSEPLVSGFTTGAACHVITTQLKDVLGLSIGRHKGSFKIIKTFIDIGKSIKDVNKGALTVCAIVLAFMLLMNEVVRPWLAKRSRFPVPAELMVVVAGTLAARHLDFHATYGVVLLGEIPLGLPAPEIPPLELLPMVAVDSIALAIVSYSIVMSMGLTFAKKHQYELRPNQELFALSVGNFVCGCFSCLPIACSLSRSVIQEQTGGKTQIAGFVSAILITGTVLWMGPFFSTLPRCVLAVVIIVALKPMILQMRHLKKFARHGKLEFITWILTFVVVVLVDIDFGLLVGMICSVVGLYIKGVKPHSTLLGRIPDADDVYVDLKHHRKAIEVPETKIFRYTGSLNFATRNSFRRLLCTAIEVDYQKLRRASQRKQIANMDPALSTFRCLILDLSFLSHIDIAGCRILREIKIDMSILGVRMFLAAPADRVYDTIMHGISLGEGPFEMFPTLNDAVAYANACRTA